MSRYTIVPGRDHGYRVEVVDSQGVRHTMLGFETEAAAAQWIESDRRRELVHVDDPLPALVDAAD